MISACVPDNLARPARLPAQVELREHQEGGDGAVGDCLGGTAARNEKLCRSEVDEANLHASAGLGLHVFRAGDERISLRVLAEQRSDCYRAAAEEGRWRDRELDSGSER